MTYIEKTDVKDKVLNPLVTDDILKETDEEIDGIIYSLGSSPENMADPVPYEVKQTATAFASYRAALYSAGNVAYGNMPGSFNPSTSDIYTRKMTIYEKEYANKKKILTKEIIEGVADTAVERVAVVELYRA